MKLTKKNLPKIPLLPDLPVFEEEPEFRPSRALRLDIAEASRTLDPDAARYLVDTYYQMQEQRKSFYNRVRQAGPEPSLTLHIIGSGSERLEDLCKSALAAFAGAQPMGRWAMSLTGVGPVLSAGFLAHIDITKAPTAGHLWNYASLNPTQHWLGKTKAEEAAKISARLHDNELGKVVLDMAGKIGCRAETLMRFSTTDKDGNEVPLTQGRIEKAAARIPWNAKLKTLCWKWADCQVKNQNRKGSFYGPLYVQWKAEYQVRNERGGFAENARRALEEKRIGKDTDAYKAYIQGKLPDGHVHSMACRKLMKLWLSHWQELAYRLHYGVDPPAPYAFAKMGHEKGSYIPPPNGEEAE